MRIKDNFWLGLLVGAAAFALFFLLLWWLPWGENYARAPFLLAFIPGILLFRMALVKWNMEKFGKGVLLVTLAGLLAVFFLV
jgi:peptidoglycan/LPS O-acetylase OafA/YrhL